jgi:hypothetical protein
MGGNATHGKGMQGRQTRKRGVSERKKGKRKKKKKPHQVFAASHITERHSTCELKKRSDPPSVCEQEGVPLHL